MELIRVTGVPKSAFADLQQVETATAAGTITLAGNATAIVTSDYVTGGPVTVTFAVALDDTATLWAAKARTAIAANAAISAEYLISGSTTSIVLTRKVLGLHDETLNIALADSTSEGITEAATSTMTTAGLKNAASATVPGEVLVAKDIVCTAPLTVDGTTNLDNVLPGADADVTFAVNAASESASGVVELATTAEINTGTDADRAMSPDAFQASNRNIRYIVWRAVAVATDTVGSDSTILESMPSPVAGVIQTPKAHNDTAGVTGTAVYDIHLNNTTIMTTTKISIATAQTASTAGGATQPVLTTTAIAVGDVLTFYCDTAQSGTAAKGLAFIVPVLET